jgi:hypothetical protein
MDPDSVVAAGTAVSHGDGEPARPSKRWQRAILLAIGMAAIARLPWDSRSQQHAVMFAIVLAALAALAHEDQARSFARLAAWDRRRKLRYLRTTKARPEAR